MEIPKIFGKFIKQIL